MKNARGALKAWCIAGVFALVSAVPTYATPVDTPPGASDSSEAAPSEDADPSQDADPSEGADPSGATDSAAPTTSQAPAVACEDPPPAGQTYRQIPWAVSTADPANRIWPYSVGAGVLVAVVGTGVGPFNPQLASQLVGGYDFVRNTAEGMDDCTGQGTAIASIIAAQQAPETGFLGLAPGAQILAVRVAEEDQTRPGSDPPASPAAVAQGIRWAAEQGATVIVVATVLFSPDPDVEAAVAEVQADGAVVVAPVGDAHPQESGLVNLPTPLTPYPAALPGVVGVGGVGQNGVRLAVSQIGSYVDVLAPGDAVVAASSAGGQSSYTTTAVAAGYAAAAVALLLGEPGGRWSAITGQQRSIVIEQRLKQTASPVSGHLGELAYGAGIVDAGRALTELSNNDPAASVAPYTPPPADPAAERQAARDQTLSARSLAVTWAALGGLVLVCGAVIVVRRVRRNDLRAVQTPAMVDKEKEQELRYVAGDELFAPPRRPL